MSIFKVVTAETIYEEYTVEAESAADAEKKVYNGAIRADLNSVEAGGGDDFEVINVTEEA